MMTGALPEHPQVTQDLSPAFQGDSSSGSTAPTDFVWLDKSYTLSIRTDSAATIHVVIGIWGTYEVARTYYVDNVRVDIAEIKDLCLGTPSLCHSMDAVSRGRRETRRI